MITFNPITLKMGRCIFALSKSTRALWALLAVFCFLCENGHCNPWTSRLSGTSADMNSVAYGSNIFVAVGSSLTILSSPDAIIWTKRVSRVGATELTDVIYGNGRFIAVGVLNIATSTDGITWTTNTLAPGHGLFGIAYGAATFVGLDAFGSVETSPDGLVWTAQSTGARGVLTGIVYAGNQFVAVGTSSTIITSLDGVKWTAQNSGTSDDFYSITYGNNQYVAVGPEGAIVTSPDGTNWIARESGTSDTFNGVTYGNNGFIAVGTDSFSPNDNGSILSSPDGITWTNVNAPANYELSGVAYGANQFVAVGSNGTILQSGTPTIQPPTLGPVSPLLSGGVEVSVTGVAGQTYSIQFSSNLKDWSDFTSITLTNSVGTFTDPAASNNKQGFYRGFAQ
jgi:hypothetical protein